VKKTFLWLGFSAITLGLFVLVYHGPGRAVLRGHVGDVAATMLVYAVLGALSPQTWIRFRAFTTLAIATLIEFGQSYWSAGSMLGELTIGDTFDPWDLVAYAIGVAVAVVWELRARSTVARCAPCAPLP
jgi:hypothetical protein